MRSLGMMPVAPGFGGHVPEGITRVFPGISVTTSSGWGNFNSTYSDVYLLEPTDSHYQMIGQRFYSMYIKEFGSFGAFNMDTYNEMDPKSTDLGYLKQVNEAVYGAMAAVAPEAIYVMRTLPRIEWWWWWLGLGWPGMTTTTALAADGARLSVCEAL